MQKIKLLNKLLLASSTLSLSIPCVVASSSCSSQHEDVGDMKSIELSLRPNYVYPGNSFQVRKNVYPYSAKDNKLNWEIIDCPYDNISISNNGVISVPNGLSIDSPKMMHIKATSVKNPEVFDELALAIINKPKGDEQFIGFANNEVNYTDVDGNKTSVNILKSPDSNEYYTDKPIILCAGRSFENIEFLPVVGRNQNNMMQFHLHGDEPTLIALKWVGYVDNDWVEEIPTFQVAFVQHRHDVMDIKFACDSSVTLHIKFEVYQGPKQYTAACMDHDGITSSIDGIYESYLDIPYNQTTQKKYVEIKNIFVYRKPYEYLDENDFTFDIEYQEGFTSDMISCKIDYQFVQIREYDDYKGYLVNLNFEIHPDKFNAEDLKYENIDLLHFRVNDVHEHGCYCKFIVNWVEK